MIRFEQVSLVYPGGVAALRDLELEIPAGEFCVFVGASGSGKTTALRLINRLIEPTGGRVLVGGRDVREADPIALRRGIGYAIQGVGLVPHMTVGDNVSLVPRLQGRPPGELRELARKGLETVRMTPEKFMDRFPGQLSGGQRQRIGIARALAADPEIVLMDEPFGALDNVLREELQDEFAEIFRRLKKTVVFVTHDMHEAIHLADRIVVMNAGRMVAAGTPAEVVLEPKNEFVVRLLGRRRRELEAYVREVSKP